MPSVSSRRRSASASLLLEAVNAGAERVVVGLGGSGTNDGGAGLLAALGASADVALDVGGIFLEGVADVDLSIARGLVDGVEIVAATDVDNPLTGLFGATKTFGPQKGLDEEMQVLLDGYLEQWAAATDRRLALEPGAGAAGGIGFALLLLGGHRVSGIESGRRGGRPGPAGSHRRPGAHR
ncbi:glycerate kinase [Nocardioides convexus]|uniref:glycerate kinase n=1 Tax=Nocardioides convexus TaxID=2712224 RepID=UPI0024189DD7|nr:glycerate kinase [Nocardioides convexus]